MRPTCFGVFLAAVSASAAAVAGSVAVDSGTDLGRVHLSAPPGDMDAVVFLYSDDQGWTDALDDIAARLAANRMMVVGVDLPTYIAALDANDERDCHYLVSAVEELSKRLQRQHGAQTYRAPVLAGLGAGGTLAYAALAQAPAATVAGAVTLDPTPALVTKLPICSGAPFTAAAGGGFAYGQRDDLPGWWVVAERAGIGTFPFADRMPNTRRLPLSNDTSLADTLIAALQPPAGEPAEPLVADLPIVALPPRGEPAGLLAIILSGDGGWRDIDKQIGEWLAAHGVGVVGIDSLRYFWTEKTPERLARDLERLMTEFLPRFHADRVILVGYSFGADVLPATWGALSPAARDRTLQLSLLGLGPSADFEFHVSGWLGLSHGSRPVAEDARALDLTRVQCFYGEEEPDTLCRDPILAAAELVHTAGGHHFDGDYAALAQRILDGAERRRQPSPR